MMTLEKTIPPAARKPPSVASRDWSLSTLDAGDAGRIFLRRWPVLVLSTLIFAALSMAAYVAIKPRYEAKAEVLIEPPKRRALAQDDKSPDNPLLDSSVVDSQIPLLLSNRNLIQVIAQGRLAEDREFAAPDGAAPAAPAPPSPDAAARVDAPADDGSPIDPRLTPVINRLADHLDVARVGKSNVVAIKAVSEDPRKAAQLANLVAKDYVADQVASRVKVIQQAASLFADRLDALRAQVRASENALADYRQRNGMATTSDEKITISDQQLGNLNERLAFASSDTALKLAKYEQAAQFERGAGDLSTLPEVVQSPAVIQLQNQLAEFQRREADARAIYGDAYPDILRLKAQKKVLQRALVGEVGRLTAMLKNDYSVARSREAALQKQIGALVAPAGVAPDAGVELRELQRTNLANKALFENFLAKAKLTQEETSFEAPDSRLISPALVPAKPVFPRLSVLLAVGTAAGLVAGILASLVLDKRRPLPQRGPRLRRSTDLQPAE